MGSENKKTASSAPPARNGPILLLLDSIGAAENLFGIVDANCKSTNNTP